MRIFLVDDEKEIADLIELYLKNDGFDVIKCSDGKTALEKIRTEVFDLAILDVMLPDVDGFTLCSEIRKKYNFPVIMLTARTSDEDKISGLTLGADVPFCIRGGTMLATGIGEVLERVAPMPACTLVVAIGEEGISTPRAYAALDEKYSFFEHCQTENDDVCELIDLWKSDALSASSPCFYNIFEDVVSEENADVNTIKRVLRERGALTALMSGSGPAVFGVFEKADEAEEACSALQQKGYKSFVCHPCGEYIE